MRNNLYLFISINILYEDMMGSAHYHGFFVTIHGCDLINRTKAV